MKDLFDAFVLFIFMLALCIYFAVRELKNGLLALIPECGSGSVGGDFGHSEQHVDDDNDDDDDGRINFNVAYSPKTARTRNS